MKNFKMNKFNKIQSTVSVLNIDNIDTDQIIGSDHLKITNKSGLGKHLFSDWRYHEDGSNNESFILNHPSSKNAKVLVAGDNFGCGSSREHAPWAILDYGIEVVISSSIADIFANNAFKNGLLPIQLGHDKHDFLLASHGTAITVDLQQQTISCDGQSFSFEIEPFAKYCLLNGLEQLDFLVEQLDQIKQYEIDTNKQINAKEYV
jgi:3-isopropylmalate/(R)-2-methylmalate dehydratase small subunit